jgi:hypothetical protein
MLDEIAVHDFYELRSLLRLTVFMLNAIAVHNFYELHSLLR